MLLVVMHAELVFTLIESDCELATSEIIVKTNSVYLDSQRMLSRYRPRLLLAMFKATSQLIDPFKCSTYSTDQVSY